MKPLTYKLSREANNAPASVQTEYWDTGLGAVGCIFVAKTTGRILLQYRSGIVDEPHEWGTWGGKIDEGENKLEALAREIDEETGYNGPYKLFKLWTFEDSDEDFQYYNYLALVPDEFTPERSGESERGKWVEYGEWPHPMHFGLEALLQHSGEEIHRVITLIKRKKADILEAMDTPPAIVQPAPATAPANYNLTNACIIATTLWGEARGEGERGMQAVMNVIMNRAKGNFKRAKDVVLAPKQFSMWNSVTNAEQTALALAQRARGDEQWQQAIQIVDRAASGNLPDITGGATFYFNPKKANPSWAKKMKKTITIGNHDFYKPRKTVKKKVPTAIREMIESQDPNQAVLFKKGLAGDGIWEYELRSPKSYLRYRHEPDTKIFYLDNIGTPNEQDKNKGYAKALLETFFQLIKRQGGALDSGPYTTSGTAYVKHVVERFAKQYGVRLVKGRDAMTEAASPELKQWFGNSKVVDKHGDPLVVFKGSNWKDEAGKAFSHIQRQDDFPSFHGDEPGIKIAGFFTSDEKVARKFCWGKDSHVKAFHLRLENPYIVDMKGATAGLAQFEAGGKPFRDAMRSNQYDGAILLNTWDEGNVFVIKDPRQAKLVTNKTFGPEKDFTKESAVDNSYKNGKMSEAYGDPGDHVIFGGVFWPERVVANIVKSKNDYFGHTHEHGSVRWSYYEKIRTVFWDEHPPLPEFEAVVKNWLEHRGYKVDRQTDKKNYYDLMAWFAKRGILKEMLLMEARATPKQLVEFLRAQIKGTEWDGKVFAVGGFVRDLLLGKEPKDLDLVVGVNNGGLLFTKWLGQKLGIYKEGSNPVVFPTFGTANLRLDGVVWNGVDFSGEALDVVMFRKEQYHDPNSRKPVVQFTPHIEVDAQRRDITFNALYLDIASGEILDPTGMGKADLKNGIVKTAIDPTIIYTDDALRMFRAVRFAAQLGFKLDPSIVDGIKKNLHRLHNTSRERVRDELNKILVSKNPDYGLRLLRDVGLLPHVGAELQQMVGMTQNIHHKDDVFDHTLAVITGTQPEVLNRLIALFHDVGKVVTRAVTPKGVQFIGHEAAGPDIVEKIMMSLKYPRVMIDAVKLGVRHHMALKQGGPDAVKLSDKTLRKFKIALGQYLEQLLDVMHADNISHADASAMPKQIEAVRARLKALDIQVTKPVLPINGNDLLAMGVKAGPMVGKILNAVTEKWYENPNVSREEAMHIAKSILNGSS